MAPDSFSFKLTVPNDPEGISVLAALAVHAVEYANVDAGARDGFIARVRDAAGQAMSASTAPSCLAVIAAAGGQLTVTIGTHSASQPLPV
jgi:hypothetical protein